MSDKINILYVDDEAINLELFEINLREKYQVLLAEDGLKGLELLDGNPEIKVVVSDMRMPRMNGVEFVAQAREKHPNIKYFILTGYEITKEIRYALANGLIYKYFRKPFNLKEIEKEITKVLGKA